MFSNFANFLTVSALPKARANLSAFGLGAKIANENEKASNKRALDFGEDEGARKKLEKLPTLPLTNTEDEDATLANGDEGESDDDVDMEDGGTEEEAAAAARAAAEKREERLLEQANNGGHTAEYLQPDMKEDSSMEEVVSASITRTTIEEDDDLDPLDAFMDELGDPFAAPKTSTNFNKSKSKSQQQEPEALFGDDDVELKVMEADPDDILAMASKVRKKKDIPTINYAKLDLEPFRKNFYTEPAEVADMTEAELADLRLELDGIKVAGKDVPKPVQKWFALLMNLRGKFPSWRHY